MKLVKKLSTKSIVENIVARLPKDAEGKIIQGQTVVLYRVYGTAQGIKTGSSTFGEWAAFTGQFEAVDSDSGEIVRSNQLFLPEVAELLLKVPVLKGDGDVNFAFDIGIKGTIETATGLQKYEYTVGTVMEAKEDDPLAKMRLELACNKPMALPVATAAKSDPVKDEVKAPAKKK
jgi:hypothetical protein